jgi:hypothetical protein
MLGKGEKSDKDSTSRKSASKYGGNPESDSMRSGMTKTSYRYNNKFKDKSGAKSVVSGTSSSSRTMTDNFGDTSAKVVGFSK